MDKMIEGLPPVRADHVEKYGDLLAKAFGYRDVSISNHVSLSMAGLNSVEVIGELIASGLIKIGSCEEGYQERIEVTFDITALGYATKSAAIQNWLLNGASYFQAERELAPETLNGNELVEAEEPEAVAAVKEQHAEAEVVEEPAPGTDFAAELMDVIEIAPEPAAEPASMTGSTYDIIPAVLDSSDAPVFDVDLPSEAAAEETQAPLAQDPEYMSFEIEGEVETDPVVSLDSEEQASDELPELVLKADDVVSEETAHEPAMAGDILLQNGLQTEEEVEEPAEIIPRFIARAREEEGSK